jgi:hypothetical protein
VFVVSNDMNVCVGFDSDFDSGSDFHPVSVSVSDLDLDIDIDPGLDIDIDIDISEAWMEIIWIDRDCDG